MNLKFYSMKRLAALLLLLGIGSASSAQVLTRTAVDYFSGNAQTQSGSAIKFTFTITNDLPYTFYQLNIRDRIPFGTTYYPGSTEVNGVAVPDINGTAPFVVSDEVYFGALLPTQWGDGVLPPGESVTMTYVVTVDANAGVVKSVYAAYANGRYNVDQGFQHPFPGFQMPVVEDYSCSAAFITNGASATSSGPNNFISSVNITDGSRVNQVFSGASTNYYYANTNTKMPLGTQLLQDASAIAFDNATQRLYFVNNSTTTQQELYYINTGVFPARAYKFSNTTPYYFPVTPGAGKNITRMTWSPNGYGYALTDDGSHLIRFTVNNNVPTYTDLGPLENYDPNDPPVTNETGGDITMDWFGNIYLITGSGKFYIIQLEDGQLYTTAYYGVPSGLPTSGNQSLTFGADGRLVVSGAYQGAYAITYNLYNPPSATSISNGSTNIWHSGDYASCYVPGTAFRKNVANNSTDKPNTQEAIANASVRVSPNPFINNLTLKVSLPAAETVKIRLMDMFGRTVYASAQKLASGVNTVNVNVPGTIKHGIYVLDVWAGNKRLATKKLSHL